MGIEKKIFSLFFLLLLLIASCLYINVPKLMENEESIKTSKDIETILKDTISKIIGNDKKTSLNENETTIKKDEKLSDDLIDNNEEPILEEKIDEEQLPNDQQVEILVEETKNPLIYTDERYIRDEDEKKIEDLTFETQEIQIKINQILLSNPISFERGSHDLADQSLEIIEQIVEILTQNLNIKIEIAGHTDAVGAEKINEDISLARANSVLQKLLDLGIESNRMKARGYGESIIITENPYDVSNRRVEFNIIGE